MDFQRNTQKPKENHHISWFCAARGHASESFFREFSVLGALWVTSGRPLATLGRHVSALGSSLAALGGLIKDRTLETFGWVRSCFIQLDSGAPDYSIWAID